jgi:hypothetical protein
MPRSVIKTVLLGCALLGVILAVRLGPRQTLPPVPVVRISHAPLPLRLSAVGNGALFVLPDGSLWRWGTPCSPGVIDRVPTQFGTNYDWAIASGGYDGMVGVKTNGTLWRNWFFTDTGNFVKDLAQVGEETDWASAVRNNQAIAALKKDGTLATFGASVSFDGSNQGALGVPAETIRFDPGPVGTNAWRSLVRDANESGFVGITADGRLMAWGQPHRDGPVLPEPTPLAPGTNWVQASPRLYLEANGRLWSRPFLVPRQIPAPNPATLQLFRTNAQPWRYGITSLHFYEIRPDGSLWRGANPPLYRPIPPNTVPPLAEATEPCGDRRDWRHLWFGGETLYGLTADGTIWVVGLDHGREPTPDFAQRMDYLTHELLRLVGHRTTGPMAGGTTYHQIRELRPLLRIVMSDGASLRVEESP